MQNFASGEAKFRHPFGRAGLEIGAPLIRIRDRLEALSYINSVHRRQFVRRSFHGFTFKFSAAASLR
jgi:hypothetical protein